MYHRPLVQVLALLQMLACLPGAAPAAAALSGSRSFDVGGSAMHLDCRGSGLPAVVLDAGLGGAAADWAVIQQTLAGERLVCVYDRPGYGGSTPGPKPRSSARIAAELRTLLARADIPSPYILGGHSFGGFNMRLFASLFPDDAAGLVLVDPPHERLGGLLEGVLLDRIDPNGLLSGLWQAGGLSALVDLIEPFGAALGLDLALARSVASELDAFPQSMEEARAATLAPDLPLIIIAHGQRVLPPGPLGDRLEREWLALLREAACTHPRGRYREALQAAHMIPVEQPAIIVAALREVAGGTPDDELDWERARTCVGDGERMP
jgi:pimeloyl-ACP methyl ester carboxylesterase